mgnify:CR=1 FL=1
MIFNLFSIPVYNCQLNFDNKKIEKYCYDLKEKDKGRVISNEGGWQSNSLDGYIPDLNELLIEILGRTNSFAKDIGLKTPMKLINGWVNINRYKDYNVEHSHPGCTMSGVFYVSTPKDCGDLINSKISLNWEKRSYEIGIFYQPHNESGGIIFNLYGFQ